GVSNCFVQSIHRCVDRDLGEPRTDVGCTESSDPLLPRDLIEIVPNWEDELPDTIQTPNPLFELILGRRSHAPILIFIQRFKDHSSHRSSDTPHPAFERSKDSGSGSGEFRRKKGDVGGGWIHGTLSKGQCWR